MKKFLLILILLLCGCQNKITLSCKYIDQTSIFGKKTITDTIIFNNDIPIIYKKNIVFTLNNEIKEKNKIYKIIKLEAKTLKKYIKGKYKITKQNENIIMNFTSKKKFNLNYITTYTQYEGIKQDYENNGFECK
jgi:hypothetical protein